MKAITTRLLIVFLFFIHASAFATTWTWSLTGSTNTYGNGTFSACESGTKTKLSGTYTRPDSGFVHLVKTSCSTCSDSGCTTSCNADTGECAGIATNLYAIELPGVHFIAQPVLTSPTAETQPIYNIVTGSCPAANTSYAWSFAQFSDDNYMTNANQIAVGTLNWNINGTSTVTSGYNVTSFGSLGLNFAIPNGGCAGGMITTTGSGDTSGTIYITNKGEFFYQTSADHAVFGVQQSAISNAKKLMGTYSGFAFDASGSNTVVPLAQVAITSSASSFHGYEMTSDTTINTNFRRTFYISAIDSPANGMIRGTLFDGSGFGNLVCVVGIAVANHNSLFCSGQKPGNNWATTSVPYSILLISNSSWTWLGGHTTKYIASTYGTLGVTASSYNPGTRSGPLTWTDNAHNFYLFGGNSTGSPRHQDLWKWDGTNWTWLNGRTATNGAGTFGTMGIASSTNLPSARVGGYSGLGTSGELYLFGGVGLSVSGTAGNLGDLWTWGGTNWTWVGGSQEANLGGTYGTIGVAASTNFPSGRQRGTSWTTSNGHFYMFGGESTAVSYLTELWKWDGTNWTWMSGKSTQASATFGTKGVASATTHPGGRKYMSGWKDSSDNLYLYGGLGPVGVQANGYNNQLWKWDGTNWTWLSGNNVDNSKGTYGTKGVAAAMNLPGCRYGAATWINSANVAYIFGGFGFDASGTQGYLSDLWKWDGTNWAWIAGLASAASGGTFGTQGTATTTYLPGARGSAMTLPDANDNWILFGGSGLDSLGTLGILGDIWKASSW